MTDLTNKGSEAGFTALFIRRPVLAFVLNTLIAVAGLAAFYGVEVRELPDVDRAVVTVTTAFEGAAGETIDRELTGVIEGAVARVSGVKSISSSSSFGNSRVTIEFNDGVDLNVAASDVRDAVGRVSNQLPDDADPPRIVKADANSDAVMRLAVTSDTMSVEDMTLIVEDQIVDELAAVRRRRRAGLRRPREDLPRRRRPGQAGQPGPDGRRAAQRAGLGRVRLALRLDHDDQPGR
jgi:HAE1 family hydrophobic/amphiphilic exporter-1